jgi:hypothetical protein
MLPDSTTRSGQYTLPWEKEGMPTIPEQMAATMVSQMGMEPLRRVQAKATAAAA